MKSRFRIVSLFIICLFFISISSTTEVLAGTDGVDFGNGLITIQVYHQGIPGDQTEGYYKERGIYIADSSKRVGIIKNKPTEINYSIGRPVQFLIMDSNPFLFNYSITEEKKKTQDFIDFEPFLKQVSKMKGELDSSALLSAVSNGERSVAGEIQKVKDVTESVKDVTESIENALTSRKEIIDYTIGSKADLESAKDIVDKWEIDKWKEVLKDSKEILREEYQKATFDKLKEQARRQEKEHEKAVNKLKEEHNKELAELDKDDKTAVAKLTEEHQLEVAKLITDQQAADQQAAVIQDYADLMALIFAMTEDYTKQYDGIKQLEEFKSTFADLRKPEKLERYIENNDSAYKTVQTITVSPSTQFRKLLSDRAALYQKKFTETIQITYAPSSHFRIRVGAGAVYSFIDAPEFDIKEDDEGKRVVSQTSSEYKKFAAGAVINIIPSKYYGDSFEPLLQLGISGDSGGLGGFVGIGASFFPKIADSGIFLSRLTLSGGIIGQEVEELTGGMKVGDILEEGRDIEKDDKWDTGLYLMIGGTF